MAEHELRSFEQRAQYYREMAAKAQHACEEAENEELRAEFRRLAEGWQALAMTAEMGVTLPTAKPEQSH
jgi:hypothetical protein